MKHSLDNLFSAAVGALILFLIGFAFLKKWIRNVTAATQIVLVLRYARRKGQRLWFLASRSVEYEDDNEKGGKICREERFYSGVLAVPKVSLFSGRVVATLWDVEFYAKRFGSDGLRFSSLQRIRHPVSFDLSSVYWIGLELPPSPMDCYFGREKIANCSINYLSWRGDEEVPNDYYEFIATLVKVTPPK